MRDEFDGRIWTENGQAFAAQAEELLNDLMAGFRRLTAIQFSAPWRDHAPRGC